MNKIEIEFLSAVENQPKANYYPTLRFDYKLDVNGFELLASVSTSPFCYDMSQYDEEHREHCGDREFMNDVPKIVIDSTDCFDNLSIFTIDLHCDILRALLTDYHERKMEHLTAYINKRK
ncbi:MAG: hypothetical protein ACXWT0_01825 [Methylobacter sp.]